MANGASDVMGSGWRHLIVYLLKKPRYFPSCYSQAVAGLSQYEGLGIVDAAKKKN